MSFWRPGEAAPAPLERSANGESVDAPLHNTRHRALTLPQQRARLPIAAARQQLLYLIERFQCVIVVGETGSGKTTQLPQYLHESGWTQGGRVVACTQPRRLAATSVAARVAEELGTSVGDVVGYAVRFEQRVDAARTRLKFLTDGTLLREAMLDPLFSRYSVVIVDEAHERSIASDTLLGLLRKVCKRRPELRVVVSSATIDAERFRRLFERNRTDDAEQDTATILSVAGRAHPVSTHYLEAPARDYVRAAADTALAIHRSCGGGRGGAGAAGGGGGAQRERAEAGDILVFLPGAADVEACCDMLRDDPAAPELVVLPLYAQLPKHLQVRVFERPPRAPARKVVVATSIAETSVTLDGVRFVVDSGFAKLPFVHRELGVELLAVVPCSRASAAQRAGRAGRTAPGECYRLYTEAALRGGLMPRETPPEFERAPLAGALLQLKALGIDKVLHFDFPSPPPAELLLHALELLHALGALDDAGALTSPLGERLAEFPCEPQLGKALLAAFDYGCVEEALTVAAMLQVRRVFVPPRRGREARARADAALAEFAAREGDQITMINAFGEFEERRRQRGDLAEWCREAHVDRVAMLRAAELRAQLARYLRRFGPDAPAGGARAPRGGAERAFSSCGDDTIAIRRALVCGFFAHAARLGADGQYRTARGGVRVMLYPSSVLSTFGSPPEFVCYHDHVMVGEQIAIHDVVQIQGRWLVELAPHYYQTRALRGQAPGRAPAAAAAGAKRPRDEDEFDALLR